MSSVQERRPSLESGNDPLLVLTHQTVETTSDALVVDEMPRSALDRALDTDDIPGNIDREQPRSTPDVSLGTKADMSNVDVGQQQGSALPDIDLEQKPRSPASDDESLPTSGDTSNLDKEMQPRTDQTLRTGEDISNRDVGQQGSQDMLVDRSPPHSWSSDPDKSLGPGPGIKSEQSGTGKIDLVPQKQREGTDESRTPKGSKGVGDWRDQVELKDTPPGPKNPADINQGPITIVGVLETVAETLGDKPVTVSDARAIQSAEALATGISTGVKGGPGATALSAVDHVRSRDPTVNSNTHVTLSDVLSDASTHLPKDKVVTPRDASKVHSAEARNNDGQIHKGGVASRMQSAAAFNQNAGYINPEIQAPDFNA